jgi:hypothetical protein
MERVLIGSISGPVISVELCCVITRAQLNGMCRLVYDCLSVCVGEATTIYMVCAFGYPRNNLKVKDETEELYILHPM